ncbi:glycoside hydrolase superfamily [Crucibulum laeve]|uniref:glucan 1,3-beta-glucosidase n=1 Tax=Crucibulum laeve TaxID=68775 RepID=A0A5C3MKA6_9AGAR|nr:glycoside hydrolase superfamily [Crucibulum laeve]
MAEHNPNTSDTLAMASNTPLPMPSSDSLRESAALTHSYLNGDTASSRHLSYATSTPSNAALFSSADKQEPSVHSEDRGVPTKKSRRPLAWIAICLAVLVLIILAVILPVYFTVIKPKQHTRTASSGASSDAPNVGDGSPTGTQPPTATPTSPITGTDGSIITTEDGQQFTYTNKLGGFWVSDPNDPYNNNAQANSYTPPLNQSWTFGKDRIYGVNLGGLFVLEPFISPALFQKYPTAMDEWSISLAMRADTAGGGIDQLEEHYNTFITEKDIADIAGAGLNWVRVPIPFWAIEVWPGEPFLAKTSWKYILRLLGWCRKYGIRVKLDLHTIPGSQNSYNHSGKAGQVNFLNGVMGYANAQRALNYIRIITEYFSQPQYKELVGIFGIVNEALYTTIGKDALRSFYLEAYSMMRSITGVGEGHGPFMSIHDGFMGLQEWSDFLRNGDRVALDTHPYFAFGGGAATDPIATGTGANAGGTWPLQACQRWAANTNRTREAFGVTFAGEFSNGYNDCGLFLKGVHGTTTYGGDCSVWQDASLWDDATKAGLKHFALASMDALGDFFFWTWKIGNSTAGHVESPLWSYQLGLQGGWMPTDPRTSIGTCDALGISGPIFDGTFQPWMVGGSGAGQVNPAEVAQYPWPPPTISNAPVPVAELPSYTSTGTIATLPPPTATAANGKTIDAGNGWFDAQDNTPAPTTIAGCTYPDPWDAVDAAVPPVCT